MGYDTNYYALKAVEYEVKLKEAQEEIATLKEEIAQLKGNDQLKGNYVKESESKTIFDIFDGK